MGFHTVQIEWGGDTKTLTPTFQFLDNLETRVCTYSYLLSRAANNDFPTVKGAEWLCAILAEAGFEVDAGDVLAEIHHNPVGAFALLSSLNEALTPIAPEKTAIALPKKPTAQKKTSRKAGS